MDIRRKIYNSYLKLPYKYRKNISKIGSLMPPELIFGKKYRETIKLIAGTEYLAKKEIESIQKDLLKKTLKNAYINVPFYSEILHERKINLNDIEDSPVDVLKALDFIDKSVVRGNFKKLICKNRSRISADLCNTGGTSGEPLYFYLESKRSAKEWGYYYDLWRRVGFNNRSKRASFRGSKIDDNLWEDDYLTLERKFSSFAMTDGYLSKIWPFLEEYNPDFIYAYPSTAMTLCDFIKNNNKQLPNGIKAFLLGSENVYEGQREYIEKVSGIKVFLSYGHSEKLVLAGECEKSSDYHAYPQYGFVEFINDKGEDAKPGELCEIVGTGFLNSYMPFVRYRTGDFCTFLGDHCTKCGRNYKIFSDIKGRWVQETLYGKEKNSICMSAINMHSNSFINVFRYQFYQDKYGEAELRIMPKKQFTVEEKIIIENEFNEKFKGTVKVHAIIVEDIPLTPRGKFKYIEQKIL